MPEYTYNTLPIPLESETKTYRCKIVENTKATLRIGHAMLNISVRETSGGGFTIGVSPQTAKRIKVGKRVELHYDDRKMLVLIESACPDVDGESRFQVRTVKEFEPKERWAFRLPFMRGKKIKTHDSVISSGAAYGGFVLVLFCVMALPGVGDQLGTSQRIESAVKLLQKNVMDVVRAAKN